MLPSWIVVLAAIELIGFLAFALGIVTAAPEETVITRNGASLELARAETIGHRTKVTGQQI